MHMAVVSEQDVARWEYWIGEIGLAGAFTQEPAVLSIMLLQIMITKGV